MDALSVKGCKPLLAIDENRYFVYKGGKVGIYDISKERIQSLVSVPQMGILSKIRVTERIFRFAPRAVEQVDSDVFLLASKGYIYKINMKDTEIICEHSFRQGMRSPLNIQKIVGVHGIADGIYYGDYTMNIEKSSVNIYHRFLESENWEVVYTFPPNTVHHIHNIIPSRNGDYVYILTGDDDGGSGIWIARDNFKRVEPLLVGLQKYRACMLFEIKDKIVYCTDTPMEQNYIYICEMRNNRLEIIGQYSIPGTCIYGECNGEEIIISTAVEPNSVFKRENVLKTYLTNEIGNGIEDRLVHVIKGNIKNGFCEIDSEKKDWLPLRLCQFGSAQFPKYAFSKYGNIDIYYEATSGSDNTWKHRI